MPDTLQLFYVTVVYLNLLCFFKKSFLSLSRAFLYFQTKSIDIRVTLNRLRLSVFLMVHAQDDGLLEVQRCSRTFLAHIDFLLLLIGVKWDMFN